MTYKFNDADEILTYIRYLDMRAWEYLIIGKSELYRVYSDACHYYNQIYRGVDD